MSRARDRAIARAAALAEPVFAAAGWTYSEVGADNEGFIPDRANLALTIKRLAECLDGSTGGSCGSGRFIVARQDDTDVYSISLDLGETP